MYMIYDTIFLKVLPFSVYDWYHMRMFLNYLKTRRFCLCVYSNIAVVVSGIGTTVFQIWRKLEEKEKTLFSAGA